jgi:predicted N-formylglutamate amidohydrolase
MTRSSRGLLVSGDPDPFTIFTSNTWSPFVIVCDHAGRRFPQRLETLGLSKADLERHIAWDIGAGAVASRLGNMLGASVISQTYSRLVIDCNRPLGAPTSIVEVSERTIVPGNIGVSSADKDRRAQEIFEPYHRQIDQELNGRRAASEPTVLIAMHSFTPCYLSVDRPWHIGLLYRHDAFARVLIALLRAEDLIVGDNEPYRVSDDTDYTLPVHGERRHLPHVGIEIRQDLIAEEVGQERWATLLARLLPTAYERLTADGANTS